MLTICARWETTQMDPELEWRMWRQLRGAYSIDEFHFDALHLERVAIGQHADMAAALDATTGARVFLEPGGQHTFDDVPAGDIVLVIGNTEHGNAELAGPDDYVIGLPAKSATDIYGINAAAIACHELLKAGKI